MKVLITGGTHGMGKGVASALASTDQQSHEIIILCRSRELGEKVIAEIVNNTSNKKISTVVCDLNQLSHVKQAIQEIKTNHSFLDGIFINAGLGYTSERVETRDGMDSHFQVNYLSQFMLTLNLLDLLEKSEKGGRVIFNVTKRGEISWDDIQMKKKWNFVEAINQAMIAKRMFAVYLHSLHRRKKDSKLSFINFIIHKTVWSNQVNIIPLYMRVMAWLVKLFGGFITIEQCGRVIAPLFTEKQDESLQKSGKLITWKEGRFMEVEEEEAVLDPKLQEKLWRISLELCDDEQTRKIAE